MKYVVSWTDRAVSVEESKKLLAAFAAWKPAAANILQFVARIDNGGGWSIVETDDPANLLRDTTKFSPWLDFTIYPVIDVQDAVPVFNEAVEFIESVG
jgi:Protein of unknown function (DUF3303)